MAELAFFMMPDKASDVLAGLISRCGANLFAHKQADRSYELVRCEKITWGAKHLQWWVKRSSENIRVSELRPFVCIWMPYSDGEELVMGSIILARNWDENLTSVYQENSKIYRCLRKRMVETLQMGMLGINRVTGGQHLYKDIGIDKELVGRPLRFTQGPGNVEFRVP